MNKEECRYCTYLKKCSDAIECGSIYCLTHKQIPKNINNSYEQLQQENKHLQQQLDQALKDYEEQLEINEAHRRINEELQVRISKSIEYIELEEKKGTLWSVNSTEKLLEILKGE